MRLGSAALWGTLLSSCGAAPAPQTPTRSLHAITMPEDQAARSECIDALGQRLHQALIQDDLASVLLRDDELRSVLDGPAATRVSARYAHSSSKVPLPEGALAQLSGTRYLGVCVQDSYDERAHGPSGLAAKGWIARRLLVIAERAGRRIALWFDGTFVFMEDGAAAIDIERIESPRWEHADLEIAPCDMATRLEVAPRLAGPL